MLSIRKFVGLAKVMAGIGAVLVLAVSPETAAAHSIEGQADPAAASPTTNLSRITLSAGCLAALQALKTAVVNHRQAEADAPGDTADDAAWAAELRALFGSVRTACADEIAAIKQQVAANRPAEPSAACQTAIQAFKSAVRAVWTQGTRPTAAQIANLRALGQAAKTACGWTWSTRYAWHR